MASAPPPPSPPDQPPAGGPGPGPGPGYGYGYGGLGRGPTMGAVLPVPGNAELIVFLLVLLFLIIIWAFSPFFNAYGFAWAMTILTSAYLISRGIAKASRVLEQ